MAIETLSIALTGSNVNGTSYISGDKNDNQIVTLTDGGSITGTVQLAKFGKSETGTETGDPDGGDGTYIIDLSGFNDDFDITVKSMYSGDTFQVFGWTTHTVSGTIHTFTYIGSDGNLHTVTIDTYSANMSGGGVDPNVTIVCFVKGTLIRTADGEIAIEDLKVDDQVVTKDFDLQPIRWIGSRQLDSIDLATNPKFAPISIKKGAIDGEKPMRDLYVSPQHRVCVGGWKSELLFGLHTVLVAAKHLVNGETIIQDTSVSEVCYFHILFDQHQIIYSNGSPTESLHTGDVALSALDQSALDEIFALFPELADKSNAPRPTALPVLKAYEAKAMLQAYPTH